MNRRGPAWPAVASTKRKERRCRLAHHDSGERLWARASVLADVHIGGLKAGVVWKSEPRGCMGSITDLIGEEGRVDIGRAE